MRLGYIYILLFLLGFLPLFGVNVVRFGKKLFNFFYYYKELCGELAVCGKSNIVIKLFHHPKETEVYFKDHCHMIPCNPSQDELCFKVERVNYFHYKLIIKWEVDGVRTVAWKIKF